MKYETCPDCNGHGVVADYGNGEDFYGPKDCRFCKGTGRVQARNSKGQFIK